MSLLDFLPQPPDLQFLTFSGFRSDDVVKNHRFGKRSVILPVGLHSFISVISVYEGEVKGPQLLNQRNRSSVFAVGQNAPGIESFSLQDVHIREERVFRSGLAPRSVAR